MVAVRSSSGVGGHVDGNGSRPGRDTTSAATAAMPRRSLNGSRPQSRRQLPWHAHPGWQVSNGGDATVSGAKFRRLVLNCDRPALELAHYTVEGDIDFTGAVIAPAMRFVDCTFSGEIIFEAAELRLLQMVRCQVGAFRAAGLRTSGTLELGPQFVSKGPVVLRSAKIGGELRLFGAKLDPPPTDKERHPPALQLDAITVDGPVFLSADRRTDPQVPFQAYGVCLRDARLRAELSLHGAELTGSHVGAVNADRMHVGGSLDLRELQAHAEVRMVGATVGGQVNADDARFRRVVDPGGCVLACQQLTVGRSVHLGGRFQAEGTVSFAGARIGESLSVQGRLLGDDDAAFDGSFLRVTKTLAWQPTCVEGKVTLQAADVGVLDDDDDWKGRVPDLRGFTYAALAGRPTPQRLDAFGLDGRRTARDAYQPDVYNQLAEVYDRGGYPKVARKLRIRREQAHTATSRGLTWLARRVWGLLSGYGYRPYLALLWAALVIAGAAVVFEHAYTAGAMMAMHDAVPEFHSVRYAVDVVLPATNLAQQDYWLPDNGSGWATVAGWTAFVGALAGWALATALATSVRMLWSR